MQQASDQTFSPSEQGASALGGTVKLRGWEPRVFGVMSRIKTEAQVSARRCGDRGSDASVPTTTAHCASSDGFV